MHIIQIFAFLKSTVSYLAFRYIFLPIHTTKVGKAKCMGMHPCVRSAWLFHGNSSLRHHHTWEGRFISLTVLSALKLLPEAGGWMYNKDHFYFKYTDLSTESSGIPIPRLGEVMASRSEAPGGLSCRLREHCLTSPRHCSRRIESIITSVCLASP